MSETILNTKIIFEGDQSQPENISQAVQSLSPQTGDAFSSLLIIALLAASLIALICLAVKFKKKFLATFLSIVLASTVIVSCPNKSFAAETSNVSITPSCLISKDESAEVTITNNDANAISIDNFRINNINLPEETTWQIIINKDNYVIENASKADTISFNIPAKSSHSIWVKPNYDDEFPNGELADFSFTASSNHFTGKYINNEDEVNVATDLDFSFANIASADCTKTNREIATLSSAAAMTAYTFNNIILDGKSYEVSDRIALMRNLGFCDNVYCKIWPDTHTDIQADQGVKLQTPQFSIDKNDVTSFSFNHKKINFGDHKTEIINISVAGTGGDFEWASNFDFGADTQDYLNATGAHPEWTHKQDHKGFDIARNRLNSCFDYYYNNYIDKSSDVEKIFLINGHSRGGAIANLIAKDKIDQNFKKVFAYTFAAPNVTVSTTNKSYNSIFNILNMDDLVCQFPGYVSNFCKYGKDIKLSVYNDNSFDGTPLQTIFENKSGYGEYNGNDPKDVEALINATCDLIQNRNDAYTLAAASSKTYTKLGRYEKKSDADDAANTFADDLSYYKLNNYAGDIKVVQMEDESWAIQFKCCAAFLMQDISNWLFIYKEKYKGPFLGYNDELIDILLEALGVATGIVHSHIWRSYDMLAKYDVL